LQEASAWLNQHFADTYEIIVVDDGSQDETCQRVSALQDEISSLSLLIQPENKGKGAAVRRGMLEARGKICLFMDADHSTHVREVLKVQSVMQQTAADVVIASRQHPDSQISQHQSWLREHMGKSFNLLMRSLIGLDFPDTQCGFKAFTQNAAKAIFANQQLDAFSFDVEVLFLAQRMNLSIHEVPVEWINEPNSRVRMLVDPAKMFADILRIRKIHRQ